MTFQLHPQLASDCHLLGRVPEGLVLVHRKASVPWFLLVPATEHEQLHLLPSELRLAVLERLNQLATWVHGRFDCDRVNVAAIGNVVPQLHLHAIGRRKDDPFWPGVVWGQPLPDGGYSTQDLTSFHAELEAGIGLTPDAPSPNGTS